MPDRAAKIEEIEVTREMIEAAEAIMASGKLGDRALEFCSYSRPEDFAEIIAAVYRAMESARPSQGIRQ